MTGVFESSGNISGDGVVDGKLATLTAAAGELWYVEEVFVEKTQENGTTDGNSLEVTREDSSNNTMARKTISNGDTAGTTVAVRGFYVYPGETAYVEEYADDGSWDSYKWRVVARRIL